MKGICSVKIVGWDAPERTFFNLWCNQCDRFLGTFSQHIAAMEWGHVHAVHSKHMPGGEGR